MQPEVIYVNPISSKARISKSNQQQRRYKCPRCSKSWVNKKQAMRHIPKCICHNMQQRREDSIVQNHDHDSADRISVIPQNREQKNEKVIILEQKIEKIQTQLNKVTIQLPFLSQISQYEKLKYIASEIIDSQTVINILKSTIHLQVHQLLQSGFNMTEIITNGKNLINERISQIRIVESFSKHENNLKKLQQQLEQHYKKGEKYYKSQVMNSFNFIKKFSERQLRLQTNLIQEISQLSFFKRNHVCKLYERLRQVYSDLFKFDALPSRLTKKQGGNKLTRNKINANILFSEIKRLLGAKSFILACDIWMVACLGLRSKDYKLVQIQTGTEIAKRIRIVQNKNKNMVTRVIPKSLANLVKKHDISYPITQQRLFCARKFCLSELGSFYGLRSLAISLILSKLAFESEIGRFHRSISTTQKYYLNTDLQNVIHGIFALQDYDEDVQSNLEVVLRDNSVKFIEIPGENVDELNLEQDKIQYLVESEKDAVILSNTENQPLSFVNQVRKMELQNNIQVGVDEFNSVNQALNISTQINIQQLCSSENLSISIVQADTKNMMIQKIQEYGEKEANQAQIIKTLSSIEQQRFVFRFDEAIMGKQELLSKISSYQKCKLPLLRSFVKCFECNNKYIIQKCANHFKICCQIHGDLHVCEQSGNKQKPKQRKFINTSSFDHQLKLKKVKLSQQNNIKQIIDLTQKKYTNRILFSARVPNFKVNMPFGSSDFYDSIRFVEQNQTRLPIEIKQTKMGYGVFSTATIPKNTLLCTYSGVVDEGGFVDNGDDCLVDVGMIKASNKVFSLLLSCSEYCNLGKFFNSSKSFQSKSRNLTLEKTLDGEGRIVNIMYTLRQILKGQQIKWFYGEQYWTSSQITPFSDHEEQNDQEIQIDDEEQNEEEDYGYDLSQDERIIMSQKQKQSTEVVKSFKDKMIMGMIIKCNNHIFECKPKSLVQIGSVIKIINAMLCLKEIDRQSITWQTEFQMPNFFRDLCTRAFLRLNRKYTVKNLLIAMLVPSGCDAAYCLAENIGKLYNGLDPISEFVKKMNDQVANLGMTHTKITEPTGYGSSTSTAEDLLKLVNWLRKEDRLHFFLKQKEINFERKQPNSNKLLNEHILGKTGNNQVHGHSFIGFHQQQDISIVMLGSPHRQMSFQNIRKYLRKMKIALQKLT